MNINRTSFIMYHSFSSPFELLDMEQRGILITAIFEYQMYGEVRITLTPLVNMAFVCIKDTLDRDARAYAETCKRNSENGKRGGRPRRNQAVDNQVLEREEKTDRFFSKPKKADNDNEHDNEPDSEHDNDTDEVLVEVVKYYEDNIGLLVPATATILIDLKEKHSKELIKEAIDICCKRNIRTMDYLDGILRQWEAKGIKTLGDVKNERINKKQNVDKSTLGIKSFDELYDN